MRYDLLAGAAEAAVPMPRQVPTILVFDSGLGGLTVFAEVFKARPDARFIYAADDAGFPYGRLSERDLVARLLSVMERLIELHSPDIVIIACNTASTLVMPHLRCRFPIPFVGTVPAIKPAALMTKSRRISVLATPGTVARDYTHELINTFASGCDVELIGSPNLAGMAEAELRGAPVPDEMLLAELMPCFVDKDGRKTDIIALGCTHYPLLLERFQKLAPWPVIWLDPAPAIAKRVVQLIGAPLAGHETDEDAFAVFTSGENLSADLKGALEKRGLPKLEVESIPLLIA
ncbi:glutamate racemase [Microvirga sp. W0021]|uniref:Glutamate racemase n=1 Tax=Hohaiivirga grylli TaxID=3133970 RepID=A0ABV0BKM2_9HYPH